MIKGAPVSFIVAVAILGILAWLAALWHYSERLADKDATIQSLEARIGLLEKGPAVSKTSSNTHGILEGEDLKKFKDAIRLKTGPDRPVSIIDAGCMECAQLSDRLNGVIGSVQGWSALGGQAYYDGLNRPIPPGFTIYLAKDEGRTLTTAATILKSGLDAVGFPTEINADPSPSIVSGSLWLLIGKQ